MPSYSFNNIIQKKEPVHKALLEGALAGCDAFNPTAVGVTRVPETEAVELQRLMSVAECGKVIDVCNALGWTFWADASAEGTGKEEAAAKAAGDVDDVASTASSASAELAPVRLYRPPVEDDDDDDVAATDGETKDAPAAGEDQRKAFRSADTIEVDLPGLAAELWRRVQPYVPETVTFDEEADPDNFERDAAGTWVAGGFNPNLLFARYGSGGHFAPHVDGTTIENFNRRSLFTVLIYLNTVGGGGETTVITGDQCEVLTTDEESGRVQGVQGKNVVHTVVPVEGACVVFKYNVLHEGRPVDEGNIKYIIRGDVMYNREPALHDSESDRKAFELYQQARVDEAEGRVEQAVSKFRCIRKLSPSIADVYQL